MWLTEPGLGEAPTAKDSSTTPFQSLRPRTSLHHDHGMTQTFNMDEMQVKLDPLNRRI